MRRFVPRIVLSSTFLIALLIGVACSSNDQPGSTALGTAPAATAEAGTSGTASVLGGAATIPAQVHARAAVEPDGHRAFAHVEKLAGEIGVRVSGTLEEHAAAEYIADTLRGYGYDVELQRFPMTMFVSRDVSFRVEAPQQRSIEAQPLTNSHGGSASGEIVLAGTGRPSDFTDQVRGKIALVQRDRGGPIHQQKAQSAAAAGAIGLVIFNDMDDMFLGEIGANAPNIPTFTISGADGRRLRDQIAAGGVRASLRFDGGRETVESINVIARSPGESCRVMLGGHYDTVPGAPGASDNASGTAAVIEMARVVALKGNPEQACFAAFGSEETGLNGSRHYVRTMSAPDRQAMRFMLNFDMVAVGTEWLLIGTPALQEQGRAIAGEMGIDTRFIVPLGFSSDHQPFIDAGIPALFLHRSDDPLLHTPEDVVRRISIDQLGESMRLGLAFLEGMNPA